MNAPDLSSLTLAHGSHRDRDAGVCLMEAVAWFAGEPHGDHPACCDVSLAAFGRSLNDRLRDDERQLLRDLVPHLVGTKGSPDLAKRRACLLVDRYLRVDLPAFLRELPGRPRPDLAEQLEALAPVVDVESSRRARDLAREVRDGLWRDRPAAAVAAYAAAVAAWKQLRQRAIDRAIASFKAAIALTEAS